MLGSRFEKLHFGQKAGIAASYGAIVGALAGIISVLNAKDPSPFEVAGLVSAIFIVVGWVIVIVIYIVKRRSS